MYTLAPITTRNDFPHLMEQRGIIYGEVVEVGVHRGDFAKILVDQFSGSIKYYGVDPWGCPAGYEPQVQYLWGDKDRNEDMKAAEEAVGTKGHLLRGESPTVAKVFKDESFGFIYLDGDHRYEAVKADIDAWWPKLIPGGILAGHDWMYPGAFGRADDWGPGIQRAVSEFAGPRELTVWLLVEGEGLPWSWYCVKR